MPAIFAGIFSTLQNEMQSFGVKNNYEEENTETYALLLHSTNYTDLGYICYSFGYYINCTQLYEI